MTAAAPSPISISDSTAVAELAAALLASTAALAQVSDDVVKIGVLTDMNGPASTPTGQGSVTAAQMAIDDFGGTIAGGTSEIQRNIIAKAVLGF